MSAEDQATFDERVEILEMFARDNRLGWDAWGNECLSVDLALAPSTISGGSGS